MLIILSPAKIQNFKPQTHILPDTKPQFLEEADILINELRKIPQTELPEFLDVNRGIAAGSSDKYYNWTNEHTPQNSKQAILTYNGEAYRGLNASSFTEADLQYAQKHLRMLSALYGVLRPSDLIQPYRLQMHIKLENPAGDELYTFWKEKITNAIKEALKDSGREKVLINLTSKEYTKAINTKALNARIIDFDFLESREEGYKTIVVYTKKARGMMARYILKNRIENIDDLKGFDADGYWYNTALSTENKMVFTR